jgi:hypothetical protein
MIDLDVLRYAATHGQAAEDEAPLFLASADEIERLREQLQIANNQIRKLCAECPHGDPCCPCQDGDTCHYEDDTESGTSAWPCTHCGTDQRSTE